MRPSVSPPGHAASARARRANHPPAPDPAGPVPCPVRPGGADLSGAALMRRTSMGLLAAAAALSFVSSAMAQLVPDRLYYGKDRPAPMTVTVPAGAAGEVEIQMLEPVTAKM